MYITTLSVWHRHVITRPDIYYIIGCRCLMTQIQLQGVTIPSPPPPLAQSKLKVAHYNQTYRRKVKSISAMDFQYFCFVSIFASFLYSRTKMLQFINIALKARYLCAFPSPCMDYMGYFYTGVESHMYYHSFDTLLLTFWPLVIKCYL